jgi:hypothetical protein
VPNKGSTKGGGMTAIMGFRQKLLGEDGSVRRGVVMVKQPGLFSLKLGETSTHAFNQSPQNVAVEPGIHSLASWDLCFALPQLLYRWKHQFGIFWIPLRTSLVKNTRTPPPPPTDTRDLLILIKICCLRFLTSVHLCRS